MFGPSGTWLQNNQSARDNAKASFGFDLVIGNPRYLIALTQAFVDEMQRQNAPEEAMAELETTLQAMNNGIQNLDQYDYTLSSLRALRGFIDPMEMEPGIVQAIEQAPNQINRTKLQDILDLLRNPPSINENLGWDGGECASCCVESCFLCGEVFGPGGCIACCIASCILCGNL